ncbi:hypothetical protein EDC96DRAFT_550512 [Choanephora cucurbitarum]|nr:hypothetical protein EDC96DRAFT_550512 [Choanephora cucurbitarum]
MSHNNQNKLDLILSKLDKMNERLQRLENQANVVKDGERRGASVISFPSYLDKQRGKMKKLIISTELIKRALEDAEGIENTQVTYKIFQQACFTQASDVVHRVHLNKLVSWSKIRPTPALRQSSSTTPPISRMTGLSYTLLDEHTLTSITVTPSSSKKVQARKSLRKGCLLLPKKSPPKRLPNEQEVPVSLKRKSVSSPVSLGLSKEGAPVKRRILQSFEPAIRLARVCCVKLIDENITQ